ncbi:hypothetical protein ACMFMG_003315 [Clarireedia jacksonii]
MLFSNPVLSTLALLLPLGSALPTARQVQYPPYSSSKHFQLVANVTSGNLPIQNFVLESYHTGAGQAVAVLAANDTSANPRIFYVNGTASEVRFGLSSTISDAGSGNNTFPEALEINPSDPATSTTNYSSVYINAGAGQPYVGLTTFPDPIIQLHGYQGETFFACNNTKLPYGAAFQLYYRGYSQTTPEGCSDVALLPQCSQGAVGAVDQFANEVSCYEDVAAIDWSKYSH